MLKCVIARESDGIMILVKKHYLIRIVDDNRGKEVKLMIRFFDLKDGIIHTTEKTEIEIDDEVYNFLHKKFSFRFFFLVHKTIVYYK